MAPPIKEFSREEIDRAKELLGRRVYPSKVAKELRIEFRLSKDRSYLLIEVARKEVFDSLTGQGKSTDPLTAQYLFLESVVADESLKMRDRVTASAVIIKLLGLNKLLEQIGTGEAEEVLAAILARRAARQSGGGP